MSALLPRDVSPAETLQFLQRFKLEDHPRVLEVGCGAGDLALRMAGMGWQVVAIDKDPAIVDTARKRGVDAITADLLAFESEPFDAIVANSSLHHIDPLDDALDRVLALLKPGGWFFLEEFALEVADRVTAAWLYDRRDLLEEAGLLRSDGHRLQLVDPLQRWTSEHEQPEHAPKHGHGHAHGHDHSHGHGHAKLHHGSAMRAGVEERFKVLFSERPPYLYRYLCGELEPSARGHRLGQLALEQERRAIDENLIQPLGLRLAARNED